MNEQKNNKKSLAMLISSMAIFGIIGSVLIRVFAIFLKLDIIYY